MTRLDRGQIGKANGIDITVKSSRGPFRAFAPTWDMVMGHKRRELSDEEYIARHRPILDRVQLAVWTTLAATPTCTFLCYCPLESSAIVMWLLSMRSRAFRNGSPTAGPRPLYHGDTRCGRRAGASMRSRRQTRSHCATLISRFRSSIHHPSQFP